jgi:hypothetical protein
MERTDEDVAGNVRVRRMLNQIAMKLTPGDIDEILKEHRALMEQPRLSIKMRGYVASVQKNVNGTLVAIAKAMKSGEPVPFDLIEEQLAKLQLGSYRRNSGETEFEERISHGGRPPKNGGSTAKAATTAGTGKRGRPVGSKNKPTVEASATTAEETTVVTKKRGRPAGSKNQPKVEATAQTAVPTIPAKKRGRPAGSTNKPKVEVKAETAVPTIPAKKRGRPAGSKNQPKVEAVAQTAVTAVPAVPAKKRGRPAGSKNQPKVEAVAQTAAPTIPAKRGRPKGSTNHAKDAAPTSVPNEGVKTFDEFLQSKSKGQVAAAAAA